MKSMYAGAVVVLTLTMLAGTALAVWPDDPATNLTLAVGPGEQITPIVEPTSDGGCWILYYNNASGNYDVYLQKVDADGDIQWDDGLLVSNHSQNSWITEWDFAVDQNDNAIVCVNDIRDGADWDVYAYSIATDGTFNWGPDGITLSDNVIDDYAQQIMVATNGDIVFGWHSDTNIAVRRVNQDGQDVWNPATMIISYEYPVTIPRFAATSDGGFLLQYLVAQGSMFWSPKHLYINRYDTAGIPQWAADGIVINGIGGFGIQMRPDLINDGNDGAISFWYSDHINMQLHAFVQHTNQDGIVLWDDDGMLVSLAEELQTDPALAYDEANGNIYIFYQTTRFDNTGSGMGGQMIDMNGTRQWTDNGLTLTPLTDQQQFQLQASVLPTGGVILTYLEYLDGSVVDVLLKAYGLNEHGEDLWQTNPTIMSSVESTKGFHTSCINSNAQVISVWCDKRIEPSGDLYLQNINPDGTLGAIDNPNPTYIELLNPSPALIPAAGGTLTYDVHVVNNTPNTYSNIRFWTEVMLPTGNMYGPLANILFTLPANADAIVQNMSQNIPNFAPAGAYTFYAHIGLMNGPNVGDSFEFTKNEVGTFGVSNWKHRGNFALLGNTDLAANLPTAFSLLNVYPNPFNPTTTISVALPSAADLKVTVVNTLGQQVAELTNGRSAAGKHKFTFDGSALASGIYFVHATIPGELDAVQKIVLMK